MVGSTRIDRHGKTLLIILVAVFVVLAVAVFWIWSRTPTQPLLEEGRPVAEKFLEQIRTGQAPQAWESTTAEFKSAEGRESFLRYVKEHPELTKPLSFVSVQTVTVQNSPRTEYVYRAKQGGATVRLLAGSEGGVWRIDRIAID
jgi:hypothetical protein